MSAIGLIGLILFYIGCAIAGYNLGKYIDYIVGKKRRDIMQKRFWQIRRKKIKEQADKKGGKKCL